MDKRRVLIISTVGLIYDGITSVIISYLEAMDMSGLDIRLVGTIQVENKIRERIESLSCKIIDLPDRRKETLKYFNALRLYIVEEKIEVVHVHGNSATLAIDLLAAKLGGARKRIAHSHNTRCDQVRADKLLRPLFYHLYTDALACGEDAGIWLYGGKQFQVLKNGRDVEKYKFDPVVRERMRKKYDLKNELVIGHVGGFVEQKNHKFLISVFREVLKDKPDARLFLVGDGILRREIEDSTKDLEDRVVFVGNTDHVEDYLQMMDAMLLPSIFEGLPLVAIEWQINGLPSVISRVVTQECKISHLVIFKDIKEGATLWAREIAKISDFSNREYDSKETIKRAKQNGFDIKTNAIKLACLYNG